MNQILLQQSEEEFGFCQDSGLTIPCDEHFFQSLISSINPWLDNYEEEDNIPFADYKCVSM